MVNRDISIDNYLNNFKSLIILGPRGTGKSMFCNTVLQNREAFKIDLLDSSNFSLYLRSPEMLFKNVEFELNKKDSLIVFIDEIQKIPMLLNEIHRSIETHKNRVCYLLTGSSARKIKRSGSNLLAGRAYYVPFFSYNINELDFELNFEKIMQYGLLPKVHNESENGFIVDYLSSYTNTYLREEILQEGIIRRLEGFSHFLEYSAQMNGQPVNYSKTAKAIGVATTTVQDYFSILEDTLIATRIPGWTNSVKKQLIEAPKFYYFDNGVLNALNGDLKAELKKSSYRYGRLFENIVINEVIKYNAQKKLEYSLFHYRTNHGMEIDLILRKGIKGKPIAIEIKSSSEIDQKTFKILESFKEENKASSLFVFSDIKHPYKEGNVTVMPFIEGIRALSNI